MSAALQQPAGPDSGEDRREERVTGPTPVVVRRNAGLAALVGGAAAAVAIAYLWRAGSSGNAVDWLLCLVMAAVAVVYLSTLVDARTPLLVADELGVRIRLGHQWRGLPWEAVDKVVVQPRTSPVADGRLVFLPSTGRALDGLDARGMRTAGINQRRFGAALAVPMGLTTRISVQGQELADGLVALAQGRAEVVVVEPEPATEETRPEGAAAPLPAEQPAAPAPVVEAAADPAPAQPADTVDTADTVDSTATVDSTESTDSTDTVDEADGVVADGDDRGDAREDARPVLRTLLGTLGTVVSRAAKGRSHDVDDAETGTETGAEPAPAPAAPYAPAAGAVPLRETRPALRAEITRSTPATVLGNVALHADRYDAAGRTRTPLPEGRELRRPGSVDLEFEAPPAARETSRVRPISTLGDTVDPLVIDDFVTEPAYDPVIGPELAAARTRLGLTVDALAERTRIRPHVIESIEVDDFAPCGGDFYARGHLRTLARVLGKDPAPLLAQFDQRYATAPINARRVFEAELATGTTGSMRSTVGGPNWPLLVGVVLALIMVWGVVRLFGAEPTDVLQDPNPVIDGSAGVQQPAPRASSAVPSAPAGAAAGKPVSVLLVGAQADSRVVVRDATKKVVWAGEVVLGERRTVSAVPPVTVRAQDAGAIEVRVDGKSRGAVGTLGEPGRRTFRR